jgi:hypothetical protein
VICWCHANERALTAGAPPDAVEAAIEVVLTAPEGRLLELRRSSLCRQKTTFGLSFAQGVAAARPKFAQRRTEAKLPEGEPEALLRNAKVRWAAAGGAPEFRIDTTGLPQDRYTAAGGVEVAELLAGRRFPFQSGGQGEVVIVRMCRADGDGSVGRAVAWLEADLLCGRAVAVKLEHAEILLRFLIADTIGLTSDPRVLNEEFLRRRTDEIWERVTCKPPRKRPAGTEVVAVPVTHNRDAYIHTVRAFLLLALDFPLEDTDDALDAVDML